MSRQRSRTPSLAPSLRGRGSRPHTVTIGGTIYSNRRIDSITLNFHSADDEDQSSEASSSPSAPQDPQPPPGGGDGSGTRRRPWRARTLSVGGGVPAVPLQDQAPAPCGADGAAPCGADGEAPMQQPIVVPTTPAIDTHGPGVSSDHLDPSPASAARDGSASHHDPSLEPPHSNLPSASRPCSAASTPAESPDFSGADTVMMMPLPDNVIEDADVSNAQGDNAQVPDAQVPNAQVDNAQVGFHHDLLHDLHFAYSQDTVLVSPTAAPHPARLRSHGSSPISPISSP